MQAQKYTISGTVKDGALGEPLTGAAITLLNVNDSTQIAGVTANTDGHFSLPVNKEGTFLIRFSFIGYITQYQRLTLSKRTRTLPLGTITMHEDAKMLKETTVTAKLAQVEMKADTFVYNAEAFRLPEGSALEALVRKLPGAEITEEGTIKINGKEVKKIMVEGKDFMGGDTQLAMKNLPSKMVNKIKAYDRQSDYARMTGIDDGEESTVLDLSVKKGMREGWLVEADLGGGTEDRYTSKFNVHHFDEDLQVSVMGSRNNVGDRGWGGRGGGNGITTSTMGGANINWENGKKEREAGYLELGGSVRYNGNRNSTLTRSNSETFLTSTASTFSNSLSRGLSHGNNVNVDMKLEWSPDTMTTLNFRPNFGHSEGDSRSISQSVTFNSDPYAAGLSDPLAQYGTMSDVDGIRVNANDRMSLSDRYSNNGGANLTVNRRLNSRGRNISLDLSGNYSKSHNLSHSTSLVTYYQDGRGNLDTYQRNTTPNKSYSYQGRLSYSEPIFKGANLQFSYQAQRRFQDQNRTMLTYADLAHALDSLGYGSYTAEQLYTGYLGGLDARQLVQDLQNSQYATYKELNHNANIMLRYQAKFENDQNLNLNVGLSYQPQKTHMDYQRGNIDTTVVRRTENWSPTMRIRWKISNTSQLNLRYRGTMSQPSMTNLIEVIDNSDPLNISIGNAGLKSSWTDRLQFFYNNYITEKQMGWGTFMMFNNTRRSISSATIYDTQTGGRYTRPLNIDGNRNTHMNVFFNTAMGSKKLFNISTRTGLNLSNNVGYQSGDMDDASRMFLSSGVGGGVDLNGLFAYQRAMGLIRKQTTKQTSVSENLRLNYRNELGANGDWSVDFGLEGDMNYMHARNNVQQNANLDTWSFSYGGNTTITTPWNMTLASDIRKESRRGYEDATMNTDELIWNATLSQNMKKWLGDHDLTVSLEWYDILRERSNISRSISATMRRDSYNNSINSYVMLHLIYRLNLVGNREARNMMGPGFGGPYDRPGGGRSGGGYPRGRVIRMGDHR